MKRPLLIAVMGYIIGIIWGLYFKLNIALIFLLILTIILILFSKTYLFSKYKKLLSKKILISILVVLILSMLISFTQIKYLENKNKELFCEINRAEVIGIVVSDIDKNDYSDIVEIKLKQLNGNTKYAGLKIFLKIKNKLSKVDLQFGDLIYFSGDFELPTSQRNYKGFDYSVYLKTKNIYGTITINNENNIKILANNKINFFSVFSNKVKQKIIENINILFSNEESSILIGMLLGKKDKMQEETIENFRIANLSHVLAVSGLHISYIILAIMFIIDKLVINKKTGYIFLIVFLIFYMNLVGFTESVVRAGIMGIVFVVSKLLYKKVDFINSISLALLITLIINPYKILSVGLQLSYIATLGIVFLSSYLKKFKIFAVTLFAQISIIPIIFVNYNNFSLYFLISNVVTSPIIAVIIILGFITSVISLISVKIAMIIALPIKVCIKILNFIISFISDLPFALTMVKTPQISTILIFYIVLIYFAVRTKIKRKTIKLRLEKAKKNLIKILIVVLIINSIGIFIYRNPVNLKMHFIDVGQGDSTLIITDDNKKILIDGGGSELGTYDVGKNVLVPYLLDRGIKKLDYIFISHFDADHCKGIIEVLDKLKVDNLIIGKQFEENKNLEIILDSAKNNKVNLFILEKGDMFKISNNIKIDIMWPDINNKISNNSINNNSLIFKLTYYNFSVLFTGDIEEEAEKKILEIYSKNDLRATVLKIAHHGSKSSSIEEFLTSVQPKIALIGVGAKNTFGHPNTGVLDRLKQLRNESL